LATQFADARERRGAAIRNLLWDNAMGQWLDLRWDADADQQNQRISASNFLPLWAGCANEKEAATSMHALVESTLIREGGVLTTLAETGEQWV
jgi:alpha,alpha-trehalase